MTSVAPLPRPTIQLRLRRQAGTCLLFTVLAIVIMFIRDPESPWAALGAGWSTWAQAAVVLGSTLASVAAVKGAVAWPAFLLRLQVPTSMDQLDLSGYRPLAVALLAGIGEELLFRAALQPTIGLLGSAIAFAIAHARTASLASGQRQRWLYLCHTLMSSVCLGVIYTHIGLLVAIGLHTLLDWAMLTLLEARRRAVTQVPLSH